MVNSKVVVEVVRMVVVIVATAPQVVQQYKREWAALLLVERLANTSKMSQTLIKDIYWLNWPISRVSSLLLEDEMWEKGKQTREFLEKRFTTFRESLLVEQTFHYLRSHVQHEVANNLSPIAARFWKTVSQR